MDREARRLYMQKYRQKYRQSDAYKKSQQKYRQSDAFKKYRQSDAYKKYRQKYQQSDAYKKYQQKYQQSDAYKKYRQSDAYKKRSMIPKLRKLYEKELQKTIIRLKGFSIPPIALEGKFIMLREIIDNLDIIEKHTSNLDRRIKQKTIEIMINQLLEKEGMLVSRRRRLLSEIPEPKAMR